MITEENSARRVFSSVVRAGGEVEGEEAEGVEAEGDELADTVAMEPSAVAGCCSPNFFLGTSTDSLKCCRKSTPIIWKSTAASRKFQEKQRPPKAMVSWRLPQQGICWPFAALSRGPVGGEEDLKGMMLNEEPVSTRKEAPLFLSAM